MNILGPDGNEIKPETPVARNRRMPSRKEKFDMVFMMVTLMTTEERRKLIQALKPLRRKLDVLYPNGMTEGDIQRDIEKAANGIVPNEKNDAEPVVAEVATEQSIPEQPQADSGSQESPAQNP